MNYVLDENGNIKIGKNGHPLVKGADGKEHEINAIDAQKKITELNTESANHRKDASKAKKEVETLTTTNADLQTTVDAIGDDNKAEIETLRTSITEGYEKKLTDKDTEITTLKGNLFESNVTAKVGISPVIGTTVLPKSVFINTFKDQFQEDGTAKGWDGKQILSKENPANPAGVNEALTILVATHPDSDDMLKSSGAHSGTPDTKKGQKGSETLTSTEKINAGLQERNK